MDTEEKIAHMKALQEEIGKPTVVEEFRTKTLKEELIELSSGVLVIIALLQYIAGGYHAMHRELPILYFVAVVLLTALAILADKIYPIQKVQEGEVGFASSFNFIVVNLLFYGIMQVAIICATFTLIFWWDWKYALYLGFPYLLIEWIKRKNREQNKTGDQISGTRGASDSSA